MGDRFFPEALGYKTARLRKAKLTPSCSRGTEAGGFVGTSVKAYLAVCWQNCQSPRGDRVDTFQMDSCHQAKLTRSGHEDKHIDCGTLVAHSTIVGAGGPSSAALEL